MEILDQTVWIHINYRTWQGKKTMTRAEIDKYSDPDKTPPKDLITPGTKAIADPERLKKITSLGKKIHRECEKVCLKAFGAYGTSVEASEALLKRLQQLKDAHNALITEYLDNYDSSNEQWAKEHPQWEEWLRNSMLSRADIENRFKFDFQAYKISSGGAGDLMNDGLQQEQNGLLGTLLGEIEKMATTAWEASFENRDKTTQKALRPIKTILNKLRTLSYIDGKVNVLIKRVNDVLDSMPKTGPIEGASLSAVSGLMNLLCSYSKMREFISKVSAQSQGAVFQFSSASQVTPTPVELPLEASTDESVEEESEEEVTIIPSIPASEPANQPIASSSFAVCF